MVPEVERAKPLLDFIGTYESGRDYNVVWGGIKEIDCPPKPLTKMTIGEVLAWQDSIDHKYMSEAAGFYQIMEDTLRPLYRQANLGQHMPFHEWTQDTLALHLLKRRGWDEFIAGEIDEYQFGNALAKEWASLPVVSGPKKGRSYYAGDGLNKSHVSVDEFLEAMRACVKPPAPPDIAPIEPEPQPSPWAAFFMALTGWSKK